jgi:uncharacterized protein YfiM (DUF2279 family)
MIRKGFWLMTGAVAGVYGYRRVSAVGRRVSATLSPGGNPTARNRGITARRAAREAFRFTRDVREGMELYRLNHSAPAGSTLTTDHEAQPEDGR